MARKPRKRLKFDETSVNELLQEIYDDSHNIRAKINRLFSKWEAKTKDEGHIAALGEQIVKLIAAEAKNQDQKIMILKYLKEVVFADKKGGDDNEIENASTIDREAIIKMVQESLPREKRN